MKNKPLLQRFYLILAFFNIYFIWGSTYLAVAFGLKGFPPFILVGLRYLIAGIILLAYSKVQGERFPPQKLLIKQASAGILMLVGGTGVIAWAEQYITSGQAAILVATEPFWFWFSIGNDGWFTSPTNIFWPVWLLALSGFCFF